MIARASPEWDVGRLPPHSPDAERSVLGSMLRDNDCIGDVLILLRAEDFYLDAHQKVFRAVADLFDGGKPADLVTVASLLIQRGQFEDLGRNSFLDELRDAAPTAANVAYYAGIVRDHSLLRALASAAAEIADAAERHVAPADEQLEAAEKKIFAISQLGVVGQTVTVGPALTDALKRLDARMQHGASASVPTGFIDLDRMTSGLQDGELNLIAARPSCGKTALGLAIARHAVLKAGLPVLFVSLEQSRVELAERLLCMQASVDSHRLRKGILNDAEMDALAEAAHDLQKTGALHIDDTPSQGVTRIGANARRLKLRHGIRLVVIDYLQLIEPEDRKSPRHEQVANISRRLKHLARELKIPVVALAQLNREVEARSGGRPKLSDLRDTGALEQDADVVMLLHKLEEQGTTNLIELIVAKQRNGPTGEITLAFSKPFMRFENYAFGTPWHDQENVPA